MFLLGCHHAREWISVEVPYLLAEHLLDAAGVDPVQRWLQRGEIWVAPMINPDGHEFSRTENRLWRKNRRQNANGSFGVDPNRNYGYMWGILNVNTSSHVPQDETYVGPRAFSEPEVRAVRNLVAVELFSGVLTYHSYSQLILYPWGYTSSPIVDPIDGSDMQQLAEKMKGLIHSVHGGLILPSKPQRCTRLPAIPPTGLRRVWNMVIDHRIASQQPGRRWVHPSPQPNPAHFRRKSACRIRIHRSDTRPRRCRKQIATLNHALRKEHAPAVLINIARELDWNCEINQHRRCTPADHVPRPAAEFCGHAGGRALQRA